MQIIIDLDPRVRPISGWVQHGREPREEFQGMVELISLLDAAREQAASEAGAPPATKTDARSDGPARGR